MSSSSTPKLPLDKNLSRFLKKIDSFSLDNDSPEFSASLDTSSSELLINPTEAKREDPEEDNQQLVQLQQRQEQPTQPEPQNPEEDNLQHQEDFSIVELRAGRIYLRPRTDSGTRCVNFAKIINRKKSKMESVNQLLYNTVPMFYGENSVALRGEVSVLLTCVQLAYDNLETAEEKTLFLKLLPTRLRGKALDLAHNKQFSSFAEFSKFIKDNFSDSKSYITLNNELRSVQQLPGESLTFFLGRVTKLLDTCKQKARDHFPNGFEVIEQELEELSVYSFKMGLLNPNHKYYLLQDGETALASLIQKIERLEESEQYMLGSHFKIPANSNLLAFNMSPFDPNFNLPSSSINNFNSDFPLPLPHDKSTAYQNNSRSDYVKKTETQVKCDFCSRLGHTYYECRTRKMTPYCTFCKTYGHNNSTCLNNFNRTPRGNTKNSPNYRNEDTRNYRKVNSANLNRVQVEFSEKCEFCLRRGHNTNECFAKERWERKQLENHLDSKHSQNVMGAAADTSALP